jgi:SAM-dependent methyltransferase
MVVDNIDINKLCRAWIEQWKFNPIPKKYNGQTMQRRNCENCGIYYFSFYLPDSGKMYDKMNKDGKYYPQVRSTYQVAFDIIAKLNAKSLLEIGSGNGSFLKMAKEIVPNAVGNEYNTTAAAECRSMGLNVTSDDISKINQKFDVVCHHEVFEHVFETEKFLLNNIRLLNDGGKLIICCPDPEGINRINGKGELHYPPHHQFDFSKKTFDYIAKKFGLKIYSYQKTELQPKEYRKYLTRTGQDVSFEQCKKQFTGHSHVVVFEK